MRVSNRYEAIQKNNIKNNIKNCQKHLTHAKKEQVASQLLPVEHPVRRLAGAE